MTNKISILLKIIIIALINYFIYKTITNTKLSLPDKFDLRKEYKHCKSIWKQIDSSNCLNTGVFVSVSVFSDNYCVQTGDNKEFSYYYLLSNYDELDKCEATDYLDDSFYVLKHYGTPELSCDNREFPKCNHSKQKSKYKSCSDIEEKKLTRVTKCPKTNENIKLYKPNKILGVSTFDADHMKEILMKKGSLFASIQRPKDFITAAKQNITINCLGKEYYLDYIPIKIIGWDVDNNGEEYWISVMHYNEEFGNNGTFKLKIGNKYDCNLSHNSVIYTEI